MGRRLDSTLDGHNIVIGILTDGMMNKPIARHFQAYESTISSLRAKICKMGNVKNRHHADRPRKITRREEIDNVTFFRRNRFLSSASLSGWVRNTMGTRICANTVQRRLRGARLC